MKKVIYNGVAYRIIRSPRKNKQFMAVRLSDGKVMAHFGDPKMREYPSTKRGDNYCARSSGIRGVGNPRSANFWSRRFLWKCKGKKSMDTFIGAGLRIK